MASVPRTHFPGALYHAMARGVHGQPIFVDDEERFDFNRRMVAIKKKTGLRIYSHCQMTTHFHHAPQVGPVPLSNIMQRQLSGHALKFNKKHGRHGHLFDSRYQAIVCDRNSYLLQLLRYIHLNPVRAGIVSAPQDWPWSSYRAFLGLVDDPLVDIEFPLSLFDNDLSRARRKFEQWVLDGLENGEDLKVIADLDAGAILPSSGKTIVDQIRVEEELPPRRVQLSLEHIADLVSSRFYLPLEAYKGKAKRRPLVEARHEFIRRAASEGHSTSRIAQFLACSMSTVSIVIHST